ncbi:MAG: DUF2075 domain-containing protein [Actinomycetales bacterium]|nr:DUF2075 domain-containing protein [Actinomycetales bacterium]
MLQEQFRFHMGYHATESEVRSWTNSLPVLMQDLVDAGLSAVEAIVEYRLPYSSQRADVVLAGRSPRTGEPTYLVVELKQWTHARGMEDADDLVMIDAYGGRPVLQPIEQVRNYVAYMRDFLRVLEHHPAQLSGVAYLHNGDERQLQVLRLIPESDDARIFFGSQRGAWLEFLGSKFAAASGADVADALLESRTAPSKKLLDEAADEVSRREKFVLLDEQQVALSLVRRAVERSRRANTKTAVIVTGGPGSGKSVIALSLLGELSRQGYAVMHATGSKSFTQTLRQVAGRGNTRVRKLFTYFNSFTGSSPNEIEVLICDEAHRIRSSGASRFTPAARRTGLSQIEELMAVARVPVFLLDEHQVVRPGEIGTVDYIASTAERLGIAVERVDLSGQFRSGGSKGYEEWVLALLGLSDEPPTPWQGDARFEVHFAESAEQLERRIVEKSATGLTARMTAGFCWRWSSPTGSGLVNDVVIGDWQRPWNSKSDRRIGDIPPSDLWASEPGGIGQVGCVYTAQGFEYDWNGVILGPDFVRRGDGWVADRSASRDPSLNRSGDMDFGAYVRNIYKVLLTRGMAGTVITSTDAETREFLKSLLP